MAPISPDLLNDTLSLISLAREAALAKGNQAQADRFAPVAKELHSLVNETRTGSTATAHAAPRTTIAALPGGSGRAHHRKRCRSGAQPSPRPGGR